jgi:hypothetical protein
MPPTAKLSGNALSAVGARRGVMDVCDLAARPQVRAFRRRPLLRCVVARLGQAEHQIGSLHIESRPVTDEITGYRLLGPGPEQGRPG